MRPTIENPIVPEEAELDVNWPAVTDVFISVFSIVTDEEKLESASMEDRMATRNFKVSFWSGRSGGFTMNSDDTYSPYGYPEARFVLACQAIYAEGLFVGEFCI